MLPLAIFISFGFLLFRWSALRRLLLPFLPLYAVYSRDAAAAVVVVGSTESGKQKSRTPVTRALPALHLFQDPLHNSSCSVPEILKSDVALALARPTCVALPFYIPVTCKGETPLRPICPRSFGERCQVIDVITPSSWLKPSERAGGSVGEGEKDLISFVGRGGKSFHCVD